jgi:hypothetical protein
MSEFDALSVAAAGFGAAAAAWAAYEARKIRFDQQSPKVIAYLKVGDEHRFIELIVENIGSGPAYCVRLVPKSPFPEYQITDLNKTSLVTETGITLLAPHSRMDFILGRSNTLGEGPRLCDLKYFAGDASKPGKEIVTPVVLNNDDFNGRMELMRSDPMKAVEKAMKKLADGKVRVELNAPVDYVALLADARRVGGPRIIEEPSRDSDPEDSHLSEEQDS